MHILGIDIGGTAIKAAIINHEDPYSIPNTIQIPTPMLSTPDAILTIIQEICQQLKYTGRIGCGFPGVIKDGIVLKATNLHPSWIGYSCTQALQKITGCDSYVLNDADAAGLAEIHLGAAKNFEGSGCLLTVGTGIGSALFYKKTLFPNTELGVLPFMNQPAELLISTRSRLQSNLSWNVWTDRFNAYLSQLEALFWPEIFIIGGGVVQDWEHFGSFLHATVPIQPAYFENNAGCLGASLAAKYYTGSAS